MKKMRLQRSACLGSKRKYFILLSWVMIASMILSACATAPSKQAALNQHLSWWQRQQQLHRIDIWDVKGAIVGQVPQQQSIHANFVWQQQTDSYVINLFGPLGTGMTQVVGGAQNVTLITSDNKRVVASNAEQLIYQAFGWRLPVSDLYYWVRGLPAPQTVTASQFDQYHHLSYLQQRGWTISYLQYTGVDGKIDLPSKILMRYQGLQLELVISDWHLGKTRKHWWKI